MSGEGGPLMMPMAQSVDAGGDPIILVGAGVFTAPFDVRIDLSTTERGAIAKRVGAIVAQCQKEAEGGMVAISTVELRLAVLADDVRSGLHGAGGAAG